MMADDSRRPPPGPSMLAFWNDLLAPLLESLRPERILEIGSDQGFTTRALLDYAESHGAIVHAIDPKPGFDVAEMEGGRADRFVFHRALSLDVLPGLEPVDVALIDGDHNRYTVLNELRLLERRALEESATPPVCALHDIGWPYGRRDLYYEPDEIPAGERIPYARRAIHPDFDELVDEGINAHLANAIEPGKRHAGVLGGIEDFVEESERDWKLFRIAGQHGLGILIAADVLEERGKTADLLDSLDKAPFLRHRLEALERARIDSEIRRAKAVALAARASERAAPTSAESGEALEEAERRAARLERQRDAADRREDELESELVGQRRKLRLVKEELEAVETQLETARRESEEARSAAREAQKRIESLEADVEESIVARGRLLADFEENRESLERTVVDLRAQVDTGRHSAGELREMLEERELEIERLGTQTLTLQTALGRARADSEIATTERSTLERRLEQLAERHERLLDELRAGRPAPVPEPSPALPEHEPMEAEIEALTRFTSEYVPVCEEGVDPVALPFPRDRRGILRAIGAPTPQGPSVDVVVSVHDALEDVRLCLCSLVHKGTYSFHLIVVDDGSSEETRAFLEQVSEELEITLIRNDDPPHGYTIAANIGMRAARADYVVLLNSDTIVTNGWLERILDCGESDEGIGILGPLSNAASHQSVPNLREAGSWATNPLPRFVTEDGVARLLESISPRSRPRLPFINGFCYVVKRAVFDRIGHFDEENFASGYCEENDFSYRAASAGFELAVVDDCYVFHAKSRSYTPEARKPIAARNYKIFLEKHGEEKVGALVAALESNTSLNPLRCALSDALAGPNDFTAALDAANRDPLEVAFILPGLGAGGSGGSHSIYQEAKGLRKLGVPTRVLLPDGVWRRALAAYEDARDVFQTFASIDELAEKTTSADVISATHFKSAALLAELRARRDDFLPAYYVQDYEPFFTRADSEDAREAIDSYTAVPECLLFAKTHWLCNIVEERHGVHVAKVEPSIDEHLFRPSEVRQAAGPLRVVAMVRPRTPRRQPTATIAVLDRLRRRFGMDVEVSTFGCTEEEMQALTSSTALLENHQGLLTRGQVSELLNRGDVFLDMSMYQAFGRTALEAMTCGCTAVVPRLGGVWEFLVDGVNGHGVDTLRPEAPLEMLSAMVEDREAVRRLQEQGRRTGERYSIGRAALSEYLIFCQEHRRRFGGARSGSGTAQSTA